MITVQAENVEAGKLEEVVDADIRKFEEWFCREGKNDPLSGPERAIIKTYLWLKLHGAKKEEAEASSSPVSSGSTQPEASR